RTHRVTRFRMLCSLLIDDVELAEGLRYRPVAAPADRERYSVAGANLDGLAAILRDRHAATDDVNDLTVLGEFPPRFARLTPPETRVEALVLEVEELGRERVRVAARGGCQWRLEQLRLRG